MGNLSDRFAEDGAPGADGKTLRNGTVDPTSEGVDGDFYINTTSNEIFGPKTGGAWGTGTSLIGPAGGIVGTNVGEVFTWPSDLMTPPYALKCDGSAVNRTAEAELFSVIGVTYGADAEWQAIWTERDLRVANNDLNLDYSTVSNLRTHSYTELKTELEAFTNG